MRPCARALDRWLALAAVALGSAVQAWAQPPPPATVTAIELRLDAPLPRPLELASLLAFAPGQPLAEAAVRRTLSNLYATGLVAEASVLQRPLGGRRVEAVVVVRGHTWVDDVRLVGTLGLRRFELRRALEQRPGAPLLEDRILRSVFALQDLYRRRGFRQARVDLAVVERGRKRVEVVFELASGARTTLGEVAFEGDLGSFAPAELAAALASGTGAPYSRPRVEDDSARLRRWLAERMHLMARVGTAEEGYDERANRIDLRYPVRVGPRFELIVEGADRRALERRGLLPFLGDEIYDQALLRQSCDRLREDYQRRGHYRARVECREEPAGPDQVRLVVAVAAGARYLLNAIELAGNEQIDDARLRPLMTTTSRRHLRPGSGRLVDADLAADLDNIRSFYVLQGFHRVKVGPAAVVEDAASAPPTLALTVPIVEGPRQRVVRLSQRGMVAIDGAALLGRLPLRAGGGPYHPLLLEESVNLIRARYEDEGYPQAAVTAELDWNPERTLVDVRFAVDEGPRSVVDRILLRGHRYTREAVIRPFIQLDPGDPLSRRKLLEVERDLYRLGVFSRVDAELGPAADPGGARDLVVRLEEGRRWRLGYGASYHSDDGIGGLLLVSRSNLGGRAGRLQVDIRGNQRDRRARVLFDQPSLGRWRLPITYTLFFEDRERDAFAVLDRGVQVSLRKVLRNVQLGVLYDYRLVDLSEAPSDPADVERQDSAIQISSLTPNVFIDRRDDPFDPTRGWSSYLQAEYAFPLIEADTEFLKVFSQLTALRSLGRWGVLAGSLRLGAIEPLDAGAERYPLVPATLDSSLVPISERFFAGGRTSHRAYERDRLGIPGATLVEVGGRLVEVGGNGLALVNLDYRFPISGPVGGTVFFDAGNVWAEWRDVDPAEAKLGVGLGLRYRSPIGPLRFEVGWKLDREPGERNPVFLLSFGNPF